MKTLLNIFGKGLFFCLSNITGNTKRDIHAQSIANFNFG